MAGTKASLYSQKRGSERRIERERKEKYKQAIKAICKKQTFRPRASRKSSDQLIYHHKRPEHSAWGSDWTTWLDEWRKQSMDPRMMVDLSSS